MQVAVRLAFLVCVLCVGAQMSAAGPPPGEGAATGERCPKQRNDHVRAGDDSHGCGRCPASSPVPADRYRALTRGTADERAASAIGFLVGRTHEARALVRRAIAVAAATPTCRQLHPLTDVLEDCTMDETTRAAAAIALGTIARKSPCVFPAGTSCSGPNSPIPDWSHRTLLTCVAKYPLQVARACAEALGYVSKSDVAFLKTVRDTVANDAMLRISAGRALSHLTGTASVTPESLDKLVTDAEAVTP